MSNTLTITPTEVIEAGQSVRRVPVDVLNLQWVYCHYPLSWTLVEGEWLPELTQLSFRRGLNGQADDGDTRAPKMHAVSKGGTIIEPNNKKLGKHAGYLVSVPAIIANTQATGKYYCSKWETPTILGNRNVNWRTDIKGYREFLRHLVMSSIVEPISKVAVITKINTLSNNIENLQSQPTNTTRQTNIDRMLKELELMNASLEKMDDDPEDYQAPELDIESEEKSTPKVSGKPKR